MDDLISRQAAIDALAPYAEYESNRTNAEWVRRINTVLSALPPAQREREDYTEMKREFLRMASYIDSLLVCSDEQKETLMNFISRIADDMPWTKGD